jgi:hypothetical protein
LHNQGVELLGGVNQLQSKHNAQAANRMVWAAQYLATKWDKWDEVGMLPG